MNKFRNEIQFELAGETIILRPTFNNLAKTETALGPIASIAIKMADAKKPEEAQIPISSIVQIFFHNQNDENKKSLDELNDLCLDAGYLFCKQKVMEFLLVVTGGKAAQKNNIITEEKKS
jgi:hypothetical protein